MCGIGGYVNLDGVRAEAAVLARMMGVQRHRGPDDQGLRLFSLIEGTSTEVGGPQPPGPGRFEGALGFNRLSILDLSQHGHQPMANPDGSVLLAFNGEVYNAFSYTEELRASGFRFRSRTDTEVILYLYEKYGLEGTLERLNGMFAIVVVDLRCHEVHIARDHVGVKPFYWARVGATVLFGSEVKSFLQHPAFRAAIDPTYVDEYLAFRYVAGDGHLLKGVRQLRPGHRIRIAGGDVTVHRYWQIPDQGEPARGSDAECLDRFEHLLRRSVESQLISDVKVGCQLSGGIDSSLVTLFARSHFHADMDTFSVVFPDQRYSEEPWILEAADRANADSHRFLFTERTFFETIESATWHLDQPLNHPNSLGIWLLAQKARELVTVLLSGEGADELLGGYTRFYYANVRRKLAPWLPLLRHLPRLGPKLNHHLSGDLVDGFIGASLFQQPGEVAELRPDADLASAFSRRRELFAEGRGSHLANCLKYEMQTYLVDLLVRQDKMTMAHSLENRVPFLDRELVEFVRTLPPRLLVGEALVRRRARMAGTKVILKRLARRSFGEAFVYRPKSGFGLPLAQYFADARFEALMEDRLLPGMAARGLLRADVVRRWWKALPGAPRGVDESGVWIALALELWSEKFLSAPAVPS
jgi:asparagine synthase (glutamine-hydrolysing)